MSWPCSNEDVELLLPLRGPTLCQTCTIFCHFCLRYSWSSLRYSSLPSGMRHCCQLFRSIIPASIYHQQLLLVAWYLRGSRSHYTQLAGVFALNQHSRRWEVPWPGHAAQFTKFPTLSPLQSRFSGPVHNRPLYHGPGQQFFRTTLSYESLASRTQGGQIFESLSTY